MDYRTALDWLYRSQLFGIKLGLEHPRRLLEALGSPEKKLRFVHIAGTNGKGSVCAFLASLLETTGHRTGRFTSPHLIDFRERISANSEMIPAEAVAKGLTRLRRITADWQDAPTFFEITTALAIDWFARQNLEWVVLETGLGGRLDATNIVTPDLCLLTPVSYDHQAWLGETLTAIAREKAGILKPTIPAISSPQLPEVHAVFTSASRNLPCPLSWIESPWTETPLPLPGAHQQWNAALAVAAARQLLPDITPDQIASALATTHWPGRFQILEDQFVIDGAHNEAALRELLHTWRASFGDIRPIVVFGVLQDKPHQALLRLLSEIAVEFWFVPLQSPRAIPPDKLKLPPTAPPRPIHIFPSISHAIETARQRPEKFLVCGSLFLVGEALAYLQNHPAPTPSHQ